MAKWMELHSILGFGFGYRICAAWCPAITVVYSLNEDNDDVISDSDDNDRAAVANESSVKEWKA